MITAAIQLDFSLMVPVFLGLLIFGLAYNALIAWAERRKYIEGYMALAVVTGVFLTLVGVAIIDPRAALISAAAFAFSGAPMIIGSIARHAEARRKELDYVRQAATLAEHSERGEG